MRSYWRSVCACMPASCAATEMTKTGASSETSRPDVLSTMALLRAARAADRRRDARARVVGLSGGVLLQGLAGLAAHLLRHRHLDGDEQVAGSADPLREAATA